MTHAPPSQLRRPKLRPPMPCHGMVLLGLSISRIGSGARDKCSHAREIDLIVGPSWSSISFSFRGTKPMCNYAKYVQPLQRLQLFKKRKKKKHCGPLRDFVPMTSPSIHARPTHPSPNCPSYSFPSFVIESAVGGDGDIFVRLQMRRVPRGHTRGEWNVVCAWHHGMVRFFYCFRRSNTHRTRGKREEAIEAKPRFFFLKSC